MLRSLEKSYCLLELEDYNVGEEIYRYPMATSFPASILFRGINKKTGREVAINIFEDDFKSDSYRDIITAPCFNIPGVLKYYGYRLPLTKKQINLPGKTLTVATLDPGFRIRFYDSTNLIIFMEYMKNGNLFNLNYDYLKSKGKNCQKMNPTIRSKIIYGVAATMKRIHEKKIIYRDLNENNVFLDENFEPKISNFGLSIKINEKINDDNKFNYQKKLAREPFYIAPEIIISDGKSFDYKVDVYSFAIFLYKMFSLTIECNNVDFISPVSYMEFISQGKRPIKSNSIPDSYWNLIQKCWNQDPNNRPTFEEITNELKDDKYAIEEFGMKTDLNDLHKYQMRIDFL